MMKQHVAVAQYGVGNNLLSAGQSSNSPALYRFLQFLPPWRPRSFRQMDILSVTTTMIPTPAMVSCWQSMLTTSPETRLSSFVDTNGSGRGLSRLLRQAISKAESCCSMRTKNWSTFICTRILTPRTRDSRLSASLNPFNSPNLAS